MLQMKNPGSREVNIGLRSHSKEVKELRSKVRLVLFKTCALFTVSYIQKSWSSSPWPLRTAWILPKWIFSPLWILIHEIYALIFLNRTIFKFLLFWIVKPKHRPNWRRVNWASYLILCMWTSYLSLNSLDGCLLEGQLCFA